MRHPIVVFNLLLFLLVFLRDYTGARPQETPVNILFIGSSYFNYNDMPGCFANLADSAGKTVYIDKYIPNGLYLADHADNTYTAFKISERAWDYVILQGVGSLMAYPGYYQHHPVYPALSTLRDKIKENCDATRIIFCMPWAYEDGMTWLQGWTDTYADMQLKIYNNTLDYGYDLGLEIAPVGWAWNTVLKEKDYPLHYLHRSDWNHPSMKGTYLMACVIFSTVFRESSSGIDYYKGLYEDDARYFQTVATNTVMEDLELWNITTRNIIPEDPPVPHPFRLLQNYPNPFNASTNLVFELEEPAVVNLNIFNILGERVTSLLQHTELTDRIYSLSWNGKNSNGLTVPGGIYIYRLETSSGLSEERKMLLMK